MGTRSAWFVRASRPAAVLAAVVLAPLVVSVTAVPALASASASAVPARAATGACQAIGGGKVASSGPHRATVVVDTGSGQVWSACISFSGTVTGTAALQLAKATITDLDPVYEIYGGEGAAICVLRGVGNQPPDCLTKSIEYWKYFRNGGYAAGGAGRSTVSDGDVEAWRWGGSGATPRAATAGSRAVAAEPISTTTTTRVPIPTTTRPTTTPSTGGPATGMTGTTAPLGSSGPAGNGAGSGSGPGDGVASSTTAPGATSGTPSDATTPTAAGGSSGPGGAAGAAGTGASGRDRDAIDDGGSGSNRAEGGDEVAAAGAATAGASGGSSDGGSSGLGTVAGLAGALAAVIGLGALARRRRNLVPA